MLRCFFLKTPDLRFQKLTDSCDVAGIVAVVCILVIVVVGFLHWLVGWLVDWLVDRSVGSVHRLACWSVRWLAGWLVAKLVGDGNADSCGYHCRLHACHTDCDTG